jgi:hypothetical protein
MSSCPFNRRVALQENYMFQLAKLIFVSFSKSRQKKSNFHWLKWVKGRNSNFRRPACRPTKDRRILHRRWNSRWKNQIAKHHARTRVSLSPPPKSVPRALSHSTAAAAPDLCLSPPPHHPPPAATAPLKRDYSLSRLTVF